MLNQHQKEFIKCLGQLERSEGLRTFEAFSSFLDMAFCSLAKVTVWGERADKLEARYMDQVGRFRHRQESSAAVAQAFAHLVAGLEAEPRDFLGDILMEVGPNARTGQFFTPWHLCLVCADITIGEEADVIAGERILTIQEPACGCGAMVLAAGEVLKKRGIDPARQTHFELTDIDLRCVEAAYVQTSLMGISATVHHGNSLSSDPPHSSWDTFAAVMHPKRHRLAAQCRSLEPALPAELPNSDRAAAAPPVIPPQLTKPLQLSLLDF